MVQTISSKKTYLTESNYSFTTGLLLASTCYHLNLESLLSLCVVPVVHISCAVHRPSDPVKNLTDSLSFDSDIPTDDLTRLKGSSTTGNVSGWLNSCFSLKPKWQDKITDGAMQQSWRTEEAEMKALFPESTFIIPYFNLEEALVDRDLDILYCSWCETKVDHLGQFLAQSLWQIHIKK